MHYSAARLPASPSESPRARLLVVDDEHMIRELYARVLSLEGYEVETAEDGVEGLEWLAKEHFDLVMMDRQMPMLDGASMLLALRSAGSRIPVIMMSGSFPLMPLPPEISKELAAALTKPARRTEVLSAVARALQLASPAPGRGSEFPAADLVAA